MDDRRTKRGLRSRAAERSEDEKMVRPGVPPASGGGGIFKSAAVAVLRQHRKLMTTGDITRLAVDMGLLKCQGKTPEATMASALYTDVKRKLQKSLFTRPQEGLFGLREWLEEGYYPEGWVGPPDGLGLAPFKRRNTTGAQQTSVSAPASASKAGRQGVRTGPGRSSKSRAARSWRTASSDAEDEDIPEDDDDDEVVLTGPSRAYYGSATAMAHAPGSFAASALAGHGEDDEADEPMGEGEEADVEEEADAGEEVPMEEGQDEHGGDRRVGGEQGGGAAASDDQHQAKEGGLGRGHPSQSALSPGPSAGRRGGRMRSGGGGAAGPAAEAGLPQDECLSPLHMLGDAAASESVGDLAAEPHGSPPAKRKRPSNITVPDRSGGLGGVEGITPKSPYEDSLAALHEIATSPSTFELTSHREAAQQQQRDRDREAARASGHQAGEGSGGSAGGKVCRARPRLHVDVPVHGPELGAGPGSRRDGGTPGTALLTDNPMLQGETTPAILLQASPVTTANGQQAMMLRQAPVLVTLPPALASPSAASAGQLDTPALLHVQLPGGAPSELMQTTLITPTGQQLTPFRPQQPGSAGQSGRGGLRADAGPASSRPVGRRVSFSGQVGILGPPSVPGAPLHQPLQPPAQVPGPGGPIQGTTPTGGQTWPPRLTPAQVEHEHAEITRVQTVVERLESKLGNTHPQVGKAWLSLSRMYQHLAEAQRNNGQDCSASKARSVAALKRARAVCRAVAESCGTSLQCEAAFEYLVARNSEPTAGVEPALPAGTGGSDEVCAAAGGCERPDAAMSGAEGQNSGAPASQGGTSGGTAPESNAAGGADVAAAGGGGSEDQEEQQHRQGVWQAGAGGLPGEVEMAEAPQAAVAVQG